eukprot:PhF_6_TR34976/c0_g1_i1/m.50797
MIWHRFGSSLVVHRYQEKAKCRKLSHRTTMYRTLQSPTLSQTMKMQFMRNHRNWTNMCTKSERKRKVGSWKPQGPKQLKGLQPLGRMERGHHRLQQQMVRTPQPLQWSTSTQIWMTPKWNSSERWTMRKPPKRGKQLPKGMRMKPLRS